MKFFGLMFGAIVIMIGMFFYFSGNTYTGKEVFQTEYDYQQFKIAISDPKVTINNVDILNYNTPIIVQFSVSVPYDRTFTYGETTGRSVNIFTAIIFIVVAIVILITTLCWRDK